MAGSMQLALSDVLPLHGRCPVSIEDGGDSGGAARRRGGWIVNPRAGGGQIGQPAALRALAARLPGGDKSSFAVVGDGRVSRRLRADTMTASGAGDGVYPHGSQLSGSALLSAAGAF